MSALRSVLVDTSSHPCGTKNEVKGLTSVDNMTENDLLPSTDNANTHSSLLRMLNGDPRSRSLDSAKSIVHDAMTDVDSETVSNDTFDTQQLYADMNLGLEDEDFDENIANLSRCVTCNSHDYTFDCPTCSWKSQSSTLQSRHGSMPEMNPLQQEAYVVTHGASVSDERKQRRKEQNRLAQEKYREKQNKVLTDALKRVKTLEAELVTVKAQKEHFRLLYEDLETQLLELRSGGG